MRRRPLADPPDVEALAELVTWVARTHPAALTSVLWCLIRSSAAVRKLRELKPPSGVHLVTIADHSAGRALIASSRAASDRLRRWTHAAAALDDVLPPIADDAIPPLERGAQDAQDDDGGA